MTDNTPIPSAALEQAAARPSFPSPVPWALIRPQGRGLAAVLTDGDADGCFDGAGADRVWIDLDGDGKFDPLTEQFPLGTAKQSSQGADYPADQHHDHEDKCRRDHPRNVRMSRRQPRQTHRQNVLTQAQRNVREWFGRRRYRSPNGGLAAMRGEGYQRTQQSRQKLLLR